MMDKQKMILESYTFIHSLTFNTSNYGNDECIFWFEFF